MVDGDPVIEASDADVAASAVAPKVPGAGVPASDAGTEAPRFVIDWKLMRHGCEDIFVVDTLSPDSEPVAIRALIAGKAITAVEMTGIQRQLKERMVVNRLAQLKRSLAKLPQNAISKLDLKSDQWQHVPDVKARCEELLFVDGRLGIIFGTTPNETLSAQRGEFYVDVAVIFKGADHPKMLTMKVTTFGPDEWHAHIDGKPCGIVRVDRAGLVGLKLNLD